MVSEKMSGALKQAIDGDQERSRSPPLSAAAGMGVKAPQFLFLLRASPTLKY